MPILNPMVPGDVPYPQYSVTTTEEIEAGITIVKGRIFTKNGTTGELIAVTTEFVHGLFQAKATPEVVPAVAGDKVQVLGPRTRMIFDADSTPLVVGEDVVFIASTERVTSGAKTDALYIGKVFEIYTRNPDGTRKKVAQVNDRVVVETVQP